MIKVSNIYIPIATVLLVVTDLSVEYFSISVGLLLGHTQNDFLFGLSPQQFAVEKFLFVSITLLSFVSIGVYYRPLLANIRLGLLTFATGHLVAFAVLALLFYFLPDDRIWIGALGPAVLLSFFGVLITHVCFDRLVGIELFQAQVVILGSGDQAEKLQQAIGRSPYLRCVACIPRPRQGSSRSHDAMMPWISLVEIARAVDASEIVVSTDNACDQDLGVELLECRTQGFQISEFSSFMERVNGCIEVEGLSANWMIYSHGFANTGPIQQSIKRSIDVVLSLTLGALTLPLVLVAAAAVYFETPGPVLYRQTRVGVGGRYFRLWKLRSMHRHAESDGIARWAAVDDSRTTRIGRVIRRLRIDELPQLYNVLVGDMSFVGPRPERPEFVEQLSTDTPCYVYRHSVKPGISGWAQIQYPYGNSYEDAVEKLKYDLYYVKNGSLALDFLVFLQTLRVIIFGTDKKPAAARPVKLSDHAPLPRGRRL